MTDLFEIFHKIKNDTIHLFLDTLIVKYSPLIEVVIKEVLSEVIIEMKPLIEKKFKEKMSEKIKETY